MAEATNDDVRQCWDALASYWDEQMEAGNTWQRTLIAPAVERLLELRAGERVLELSCGNGEFARRMTELGGAVLATDFSEPMLEHARAHGGDIDYRHLDATDRDAVRALATDGPFDAAVTNMAIMDMIDIDPMAEALASLVRPHGRLVISTLHPAFNSGEVIRVEEETENERGRVIRTHSIKRSTYITPSVGMGTALESQPTTHWYFHRPLHVIVAPFLDHGWVIDGLEEPVLEQPDPPFDEIPGVIVVRFRRP
ncbi:MAG: methyltransferase domain-containing protein [Actinomycetota bacterium]